MRELEAQKQEGIRAFSAGSYADALGIFECIVSRLSSSQNPTLLKSCLLNIAACAIELQQYSLGWRTVVKILTAAPTCPKAVFRGSICLILDETTGKAEDEWLRAAALILASYDKLLQPEQELVMEVIAVLKTKLDPKFVRRVRVDDRPSDSTAFDARRKEKAESLVPIVNPESTCKLLFLRDAFRKSAASSCAFHASKDGIEENLLLSLSPEWLSAEVFLKHMVSFQLPQTSVLTLDGPYSISMPEVVHYWFESPSTLEFASAANGTITSQAGFPEHKITCGIDTLLRTARHLALAILDKHGPLALRSWCYADRMQLFGVNQGGTVVLIVLLLLAKVNYKLFGAVSVAGALPEELTKPDSPLSSLLEEFSRDVGHTRNCSIEDNGIRIDEKPEVMKENMGVKISGTDVLLFYPHDQRDVRQELGSCVTKKEIDATVKFFNTPMIKNLGIQLKCAQLHFNGSNNVGKALFAEEDMPTLMRHFAKTLARRIVMPNT